ncbi:hypothetical protein NQ318_011995 [Aromia moschata]|uniref:Uncharacterized protein n=1 Tax=Aromia moschata TaxID=1265417 RepID=A0AAV8XK97_9CUCU|nr:hypothetical protein NQ318_011995 [Aromia moschata]
MRNRFTHEHLVNFLCDSEPEDYRNFLRIDQEYFDYLLEFVRPDIEKKDTNMREAISASQRLSITLRWYLTSGIDLEDLKFTCAIPPQTLEFIIMETCSAITKALKENIQDVVIKQERRSRYAKYSVLIVPKYPERRISQTTISRIENKFREFGNVTDIAKSGRKRILDDEQKLDILIDIQYNPHKPTRLVAADNATLDRRRSIQCRIKELQRHTRLGNTDKSAIPEHIHTNDNHKIDYENTRVLDKTTRYYPSIIEELAARTRQLHFQRVTREDGYRLSNTWRLAIPRTSDLECHGQPSSTDLI